MIVHTNTVLAVDYPTSNVQASHINKQTLRDSLLIYFNTTI